VGPRSRYKIKNTITLTEPNDKKWASFFQAMPSKAIGFAAFDGDKMIGVALGLISESFWDTQRVGKVIVWYVEPEYRGITAIKLMNRLMEWFFLMEVDYIVASADFNSEASRAYKHMGFKPLEETFYFKR
jgi:predicted GNAT family acetyltransferase